MSNEKGLKIKLGTNLETNTSVEVDLLAEPHVVLTGEVGVDVSEHMKDFVFQLMDNTSPDKLQFLAVNREDLNCRYSYLMKAKAITVSEYNKKIESNSKWAKDNNLPYLPYQILLIDDFGKLEDENGAVKLYANRLLQSGRNAGLFLILVSSVGRPTLLGGEIKNNTSTQISLLKNGEALVNKRGNVFKVNYLR